MGTRYTSGRSAENYLRDKLESAGYYVVRSAGSKGAADLIAGNGERVLAIQVKHWQRAANLSPEDKADLLCAARQLKAVPLFVRKEGVHYVAYNALTGKLESV